MAKARRTTLAAPPAPQPSELDQPSEPVAPQSAGDTTAAGFERERIAQRAYELYLARGGADGQDLEDWLTAEREVARLEDD